MELPKSRQPIPSHAKKVFEGILYSVWHWEQEMYDGTIELFEKIARVPSAMVIPVTADGKIVLARQEQPGRDVFIGSIGGRVDKGEDVETAAKRELLEEAGMQAKELRFLYALQPFSHMEYVDTGFIAVGAEKVADQSLDAGEKIELMYLSFEEFLQITMTPEFRDTQIKMMVLEALAFPEKRKELENLFFSK